MNLDKPEISVLLPVYNGDKFLIKSIESILNQTYGIFELIIINDGSNDDSLKIIESFNDRRIKLSDSGIAGESDSNNTVHVRGEDDSLKLNAAGNGHTIFERE